MTSFEQSVTIRRPVEEVWTYVMETANNPAWQGPIVEVRRPAGMPLEVGAEIPEVASFLGKRFQVTLVVSELEPLTRSAVRTSAGPVRLDGSYRFEPVPGGTRFTMAGEVEAHGVFCVAEPVFAGETRREAASSCQRLKQLLEAEITADAP